MCRYVLIAVVLIGLVLMALAAVVVELFGWTGFAVYAVCLVVIAWLAKRAAPRLLMRLITRPMRKFGEALKGYSLAVHSIGVADAPESDEEPEWSDDRSWRGLPDKDEEDSDEDDEDEDEFDPADLDWYWIEFTLSPPDEGAQGRMIRRVAWHPQLIGFNRAKRERTAPPGLTGPFASQLANLQSADVQMAEVEVLIDDEFEQREEEVFGEQRLRARVGVGPDVRTVALTYAHFTDLGEITIPRIDITPDRDA